MKMMNKTSLALAMATCLGIVSPQTHAIVKLKLATGDTTTPAATTDVVGGPVLFASEQSGESSLSVLSNYNTGWAANNYSNGDLSVIIPIPPLYEVVGTKTLFVRVTLSNGSKFAAEPYLVCPNSGATATTQVGITSAADGGGATAIAAASGLIVTATTPAAGKATATYNIVSGLTTNAAGQCLVTFQPPAAVGMATAYTVTNRGEIGMSVEVGYVQGAAAATALASGVVMKFVTGLKAEVTASEFGGAIPGVTIDVKQASKKFVANGTMVTPTVATLGSIRVTSAAAGLFGNASGLRLSDQSATDVTAGLILATGTVTINGPLLAGVQTVTLYQAANCTTPSTAPAASPSTSSGSSGAVAGSVTVAGIPVAELATGLNICATVPTTTTLNGGQLTAVLVGGGVDTKFVPDLGPGGNLVNVGINGARVRVLNIPAADNADQAFIRFYNTSTQDTVVRGTLYGQDGKILGTENVVLFDALKANDVEALSVPQLAQKIGGTTPLANWSGRAWLLVQAEVEPSAFKIQGLVRTPANVLVNLSTDAAN